MDNSRVFKVKGDCGTYEAIEIQSRINTSTLNTTSYEVGLSKYQLSDGRRLNRKDENTFVIVQTGEILHVMNINGV